MLFSRRDPIVLIGGGPSPAPGEAWQLRVMRGFVDTAISLVPTFPLGSYFYDLGESPEVAVGADHPVVRSILGAGLVVIWAGSGWDELADIDLRVAKIAVQEVPSKVLAGVEDPFRSERSFDLLRSLRSAGIFVHSSLATLFASVLDRLYGAGQERSLRDQEVSKIARQFETRFQAKKDNKEVPE